MQKAPSRIWTRVTNSMFYDDYHYVKCASAKLNCIVIDIMWLIY